MKHHDQSRQVAANLRALVEKHGITHQALADAVIKANGNAVRRESVSNLLGGKFSPTLNVLFQYLNALNQLAGTGYNLKDIQP